MGSEQIPGFFGHFLKSEGINLEGNLDADEFTIDVVAQMSKDGLIQNFGLDTNDATKIHQKLSKKRKIITKDSYPKTVKKFFTGLFKHGNDSHCPQKFVEYFDNFDVKLQNDQWLNMDFITATYSGATEPFLALYNNGTKESRKRLVNQVTDEGWTPLMYAAMLGRVNICRFLLENDANMKMRNSNGQTALMIASSFGHSEIIKIMVEFAVKKAKLFKNRISQEVVKDEILLKFADKNGFTALHYAAVFDQANALKILLGLGADPNVPDNEGMTPTLHSCEYLLKNKECLIELIKNGGKVCVRNKAGKTGLDLTDDPGLVMELLQKYSEKPKYEMLTQRSC